MDSRRLFLSLFLALLLVMAVSYLHRLLVVNPFIDRYEARVYAERHHLNP